MNTPSWFQYSTVTQLPQKAGGGFRPGRFMLLARVEVRLVCPIRPGADNGVVVVQLQEGMWTIEAPFAREAAEGRRMCIG